MCHAPQGQPYPRQTRKPIAYLFDLVVPSLSILSNGMGISFNMQTKEGNIRLPFHFNSRFCMPCEILVISREVSGRDTTVLRTWESWPEIFDASGDNAFSISRVSSCFWNVCKTSLDVWERSLLWASVGISWYQNRNIWKVGGYHASMHIANWNSCVYFCKSWSIVWFSFSFSGHLMRSRVLRNVFPVAYFPSLSRKVCNVEGQPWFRQLEDTTYHWWRRNREQARGQVTVWGVFGQAPSQRLTEQGDVRALRRKQK